MEDKKRHQGLEGHECAKCIFEMLEYDDAISVIWELCRPGAPEKVKEIFRGSLPYIMPDDLEEYFQREKEIISDFAHAASYFLTRTSFGHTDNIEFDIINILGKNLEKPQLLNHFIQEIDMYIIPVLDKKNGKFLREGLKIVASRR